MAEIQGVKVNFEFACLAHYVWICTYFGPKFSNHSENLHTVYRLSIIPLDWNNPVETGR